MSKVATPQKKKRNYVIPLERISPSTEYDVPEFRERLQRVLDERGWSQRQLARYSKRDPRQINLTVISTYKPDLQLLKDIAIGLNISIDWMLGVGKRPTLDESVSETLTMKLNGNQSMTLPKLWVESVLGVPVEDVELINADSDDMAPTICRNDLLFVKHCGFTKRSGIFMLKTAGGNILRRIKYNAITGQLIVTQDSDKNDETVTEEKKLTVVGPVTKVGHKMYSL